MTNTGNELSASDVQQQAPAARLSDAERHQVLVEWNQTDVPYPPEVCLHDLIEEQAKRTPDGIALISDESRLTFSEMNAKANQLARYLQGLGVGRDSIVAICMERSIEMVIGIVGTLKAGGAFLPLDTESPRDRLETILEDAKPVVVLTQDGLLDRLPASKFRALALDSQWDVVAPESSETPSSSARQRDLAYVLFTSGSTGKPKGALIPHRAIVNHMLWMRDTYQPAPSDRVLQRTPYTFDASVWEFFLPLISGAALVIAKPGGHKDTPYLISLVVREKVSIAQFVPSMLRIFLEGENVESCRSLRVVFCGGEALTLDLQQLFFERLPGAELHNLYGPTECAIDSTVFACRKDWDRQNVQIGKQISNLQTYILDESLSPVPPGETGELYIGGAGVGCGYLNRPELTAERFIPDPFSERSGDVVYKTGDITRFLPSGDIEYVGRVDFQVKIHGLRIELGEIEAAIREYPGIRQVVVIAREDIPGTKRLVAYVALKSGEVFSSGDLRDFLKTKLPEYMVPAAVVTLLSLPLTPNGKVDRKALPMPAYEPLESSRDYVAPRTQTERAMARIWSKSLGIEKIGIRDSFFDLGGTSLLALRLFAQISEEFGSKLSLNSLFDTPTIEQLSKAIDGARTAGPKYRLVTIQEGGSKPPLYWLPGGIGSVLAFRQVSLLLGPDQPVYGLEFRLPQRGEAFDEVTERATHFVEQIRSHQPNGPYYLAGFCSGVLVAYEMAQQLAAQGHRTAFLGLIEGTAAEYPGAEKDLTRYRRQHLWWRSKNVLKRGPTGIAKWLWGKLNGNSKADVSKLASAAGPACSVDDRADLVMENLHRMERALLEVENRYRPKAFKGDANFFIGTGDYRFQGISQSVDPRLSWRHLIQGRTSVDTVPGDHLEMLRKPYVKQLAEKLSDRLCESQRNEIEGVGSGRR